jgi:hypothetical protein
MSLAKSITIVEIAWSIKGLANITKIVEIA